MVETYHGTLFHPTDLPEADVTLLFFENDRYAKREHSHVDEDEYTKVIVKGVKSWDVVHGGEEAEQIEAITGEIDERHEYLVLHFVGGCVNIYRNSHVAMFVL